MGDARREQEEGRVRLAAEAARIASWQAMLQAEAEGGRAAVRAEADALAATRAALDAEKRAIAGELARAQAEAARACPELAVL